MAVPFAYHEPRSLPTTPAAIYVSLSVYLHTPPGLPESRAQFIWYTPNLNEPSCIIHRGAGRRLRQCRPH